ncbi:polygalacturonase [Roridomyces roridus]|uniref:endo-polygalacturonase n=1 Tax=Roridomyces roridus TaxID=1738132 RepID=A0AAD7B9G2_9AGAR|nr:polygalacturonase [Roridomyces roridus]
MPSLPAFLRLASLIAVAVAIPSQTDTAKRATCTVNSVSSASGLSSCTAVIIEAFTVASGETVTIEAASGATVTMTGDITFDKTTSAGPLFTLDTTNVVFNGGNHNINGNGALYWDGQGTNGGVAKPHPFIKFKGSGTFEDVTVLNSPAQAISVGTTGTAVITNVNVNNAAGNTNALGANTDGFDVEGDDISIVGGTVNNQDDCVAINGGDTITIDNLTCIGSHGISIGSIATGKSVSNVKIGDNTITGGLYGLRLWGHLRRVSVALFLHRLLILIRRFSNKISGITEYGVLITQSYPDNDSTPGTGAPITDVTFSGTTTSVSVDSDAFTLVVDCGACSGTWNFGSLDASGGKGHIIAANDATIEGGTY